MKHDFIAYCQRSHPDYAFWTKRFGVPEAVSRREIGVRLHSLSQECQRRTNAAESTTDGDGLEKSANLSRRGVAILSDKIGDETSNMGRGLFLGED